MNRVLDEVGFDAFTEEQFANFYREGVGQLIVRRPARSFHSGTNADRRTMRSRRRD